MAEMTWRRIAVYGTTGAGKTTAAARMGQILNLPVVELDSLFWEPNWTAATDDQFRASIREALEAHSEGWICDGSYTSKAGDIVLPLVDAVVWLRLPFRIAYWRVVRRTIGRAWTGESLWGTNYESWRQVLSRDSALVVAITRWSQQSVNIAAALNEIKHETQVVELRSPREVQEFLRVIAAGTT
jgi:adenylate kinase family enzyme